MLFINSIAGAAFVAVAAAAVVQVAERPEANVVPAAADEVARSQGRPWYYPWRGPPKGVRPHHHTWDFPSWPTAIPDGFHCSRPVEVKNKFRRLRGRVYCSYTKTVTVTATPTPAPSSSVSSSASSSVSSTSAAVSSSSSSASSTITSSASLSSSSSSSAVSSSDSSSAASSSSSSANKLAARATGVPEPKPTTPTEIYDSLKEWVGGIVSKAQAQAQAAPSATAISMKSFEQGLEESKKDNKDGKDALQVIAESIASQNAAKKATKTAAAVTEVDQADSEDVFNDAWRSSWMAAAATRTVRPKPFEILIEGVKAQFSKNAELAAAAAAKTAAPEQAN